MPVLYRRGLMESTRVTMISPDYISPNPDQPRRYFDLQPLSVRRKGGGRYELIAGERRLRAAMICGLEQVPCLVLEVSRESSCLLSLIENLQRRDLDFWEEAKALERLISVYGLSQEEAAAKVGKSQSAVANKLRLLRLPQEVLTLRDQAKEKKVRRPLFIRDVRFFLNTLDHSLTVMRSAGVDAKCQRVEEGDDILLTIRIPKAKAPSGPA